MDDLEQTVRASHDAQHLRRAVLKLRPQDADKTEQLDAQIRQLAEARIYGDLHDRLLPPNALQDLKKLAELIHLDYSRICRWYILNLIAQIHWWSIDGDEETRDTARDLAKELGEALVLSPGRGRPPYVLTSQAALEEYEKFLPRVKSVWITSLSKRPGALRGALMKEFSELPERDIPSEDFLCSPEATPSDTTQVIVAQHRSVSVRHLVKLLAEARKALRSRSTSRK